MSQNIGGRGRMDSHQNGPEPKFPAKSLRGPGGSISNNELDFKTYVLYVIPGDDASEKAQQMAAKYNDIQISNILTIPPAKRPTWLTGAPILVNMKQNQAHKGSQALKELQEMSKTIIGGDSGLAGIGYDSTLGYDSEIGHSESITRSKTSGCEIVPMLDDERRYTNSGRLKDTDINSYAEKRSQFESFQK